MGYFIQMPECTDTEIDRTWNKFLYVNTKLYACRSSANVEHVSVWINSKGQIHTQINFPPLKNNIRILFSGTCASGSDWYPLLLLLLISSLIVSFTFSGSILFYFWCYCCCISIQLPTLLHSNFLALFLSFAWLPSVPTCILFEMLYTNVCPYRVHTHIQIVWNWIE